MLDSEFSGYKFLIDVNKDFPLGTIVVIGDFKHPKGVVVMFNTKEQYDGDECLPDTKDFLKKGNPFSNSPFGSVHNFWVTSIEIATGVMFVMWFSYAIWRTFTDVISVLRALIP